MVEQQRRENIAAVTSWFSRELHERFSVGRVLAKANGLILFHICYAPGPAISQPTGKQVCAQIGLTYNDQGALAFAGVKFLAPYSLATEVGTIIDQAVRKFTQSVKVTKDFRPW